MRTIKFRGWNGKKMLFYNSWFTLHNNNVLCFEESSDHDYVDDSDVDYPEKVELMQFTGLTDKNGKEIYEGDIYKPSDSFIVEWTEKVVGIIEFKNGSFIGVYRNKKGEILDSELYMQGTIEVIGNIYENEDLLKENKG